MTKQTRIGIFLLTGALLAGPVAAQNPAPAPTPDSVEQARQRAREAAQRAREAAEQAREAAQRVREQENQLRQQRLRGRGERGPDRGGPEFTETFSRTIRLGRNGSFDLSNISGDITVTGGNGEDLKIDAVKRVRRTTEQEAKTLLQEIQIQVSERSGQVEVRTEYPRNRRNWSGEVEYTVAVPAGANVILRSVSGDLRVTNVRGELRAETVSGDVNASGIGRLRGARSVSGDLVLTDIEGEDVTASTVSGDVTARNVRVRSVDLQAVSGDLRFVDATADRVALQTISGTIDYAGRLARNGRYQMQSQSGDIRLTPASDTGFDLEAGSFSGTVRTDLQFRTGGTIDAPRRGPRAQTLRGTVGDAGAVVTLRSFSGDVAVLRR